MLKDFQGSAPLTVTSIQRWSTTNASFTSEEMEAEAFIFAHHREANSRKHTYSPGHEIPLDYSRLSQHLPKKINAELIGYCLYPLILIILYYIMAHYSSK